MRRKFERIIIGYGYRGFVFGILAFGLFFGAAGSANAAPHPHLWLSDTTTVNRLVAMANANSAQWVALKGFCDSRTIPDWDYQGQNAYLYVANFSLCYRVEMALGDTSAAATYGAKAVTALTTNVAANNNQSILTFSAYTTDSGYGIRNYVPALALAYDWLYDYSGLSAGNKTAISSRIGAWLTWYAANGYCASDASDCYPAVLSNYHSGYVFASVLGSVALDGDTADAPLATGATLFNEALGVFDVTLEGGHWPEGWNYGSGVYQRYAMMASALKTYTGTASYGNSTWLSDGILFKLNAVTPDGLFFYDDGAWTGDHSGVPSGIDIAAAGHLYGWSSQNGQLAQNYLQHISGPFADNPQWIDMLLYDPNGAQADLSAITKSYLAPGFGLVTMRSGWNVVDGTWASLVSGPYLSAQGAQEPDEGHIEIYKKGSLLINAGTGLYLPANQTNTSSKNTFTLENRVGSSYFGQRTFYTGTCPNPNGDNPIGITRYHDAGDYVFTAGEFSAAYQLTSDCTPPSETGVSWLQRNILYIRPDVEIVYDQVKKQTGQTTMVPTQHFHFPTSPTQVSGTRQLQVDTANGRLQFATVFPASETATLTYDAINATDGPGIANYHLKVAYSDATPDYQKFLTVLRAGLPNVSYTFPTITAITGTNVYGSELSGLSASGITGSVVVAFADNGLLTVPASLQYQYPTASGTTQYVALLKPSTSYGIVTGVSGSDTVVTITEGGATATTDAAGVLTFTPGSSDVTAPAITSISSSATNGTYNQGDVIDIDVTFSEAVTSTGSVTVTLETGTTDRTCTFTISSSTTGTCNYTVQAGDTSSDLTVNSIAGVVNDASSNPMTTPTTPTTNLAANKALVIDTLAPGAPSGLVVN